MYLLPGQRLGSYEVIALLGVGGMGQVYRARDPRLERDIALKVLQTDDAEHRKRFAREARAIAALNHPNIVAVFDSGSDDGTHFIVTELVEGETLADRLRRDGPMPPEETVAAVRRGALLIDLRPTEYRWREGEVSGAIPVPRHVLEWRLEPGGEAALPVAEADLHVVVLCSEGYTSSLAAAALQELGVHRATDVAGGFRAWAAAGLPTTGGSVPPTPEAQVRDETPGH